jgi:outer membrane protein OmpA-like peptidoglycan-associated protein
MIKLIKYTAILAFATFIGPRLFSQNTTVEKINWHSFEEAVALNKKNPKKIFIDIYTDWCGWCKQLDKTTFSDTTIIHLMNKCFIAVKFNAERKDTIIFNNYTFVNPNPTGFRSPHQLASSLLKGSMSYPSMVFLDEKMQMITSVQGYMKPNDLEPILTYFAQDKYLKMSYDTFLLSYKLGSTKAAKVATQSVIMNTVKFDAGRSTIKESAYPQLDSMVLVMKNDVNMKIEINGFTDNSGNATTNKTLSEKRANAVYNYFIAKGIKVGRMTYAGYGSLNPIAANTTDEGQKRNRRIEIKVVSK